MAVVPLIMGVLREILMGAVMRGNVHCSGQRYSKK